MYYKNANPLADSEMVFGESEDGVGMVVTQTRVPRLHVHRGQMISV